MSRTGTARALLVVALQDLHDAERAWGERGAGIAAAAGSALRTLFEQDLATAARQKQRLERMLEALDATIDGDPNIWLRAILDDAERDIASIVPGPLRDTALVGALRKGKQAERVSYETAIALARQIGIGDAAEMLAAIRDEEQAFDDALAGLLCRLTNAGDEGDPR